MSQNIKKKAGFVAQCEGVHMCTCVHMYTPQQSIPEEADNRNESMETICLWTKMMRHKLHERLLTSPTLLPGKTSPRMLLSSKTSPRMLILSKTSPTISLASKRKDCTQMMWSRITTAKITLIVARPIPNRKLYLMPSKPSVHGFCFVVAEHRSFRITTLRPQESTSFF